MSAINVTFNNYDLQDANFKTRIIQHTSQPFKEIVSQAKGRRDGMTIVDVRYLSREIIIEGTLKEDDRQSLVDKIDEMKKKLRATSGNLDIDFGTSTRRYFATVEDLQLPEDYFNVDIINYRVTFICADPFGYPTASGIINISGITNMLYDLVVTVSGTVVTDPVLHLTVNVSSAMETIEFSNETSGESIIVAKPGGGTFSSGDEIVINGKSKAVFLNASGIDYTGIFPTIEPDTATFRIAVQGSSANYDMIIRYLPAFL